MHAIVCHEHGGPEVMRYEELPTPEPKPDEILVRTEAVGINFVDVMRRSGDHPAPPATPFTPGIELSGEVVGLGDAVNEFGIGERVIGRLVTHGSYAEYVCVERRFAVSCWRGFHKKVQKRGI